MELSPGYPGYQGYVTGVDGPGDHACLEVLQLTAPSFDRDREDGENTTAAQRLGLSGAPDNWTWENRMAVEAERGLEPTCYSGAILNAPTHEGSVGPSSVAPDDPRLLLGGFGTTLALSRIEQEFGLASGDGSSLQPSNHLLKMAGKSEKRNDDLRNVPAC